MNPGYPNDNNEEDTEMKDLFYSFILLCFVVFCGFYLEATNKEDVRQITKPEGCLMKFDSATQKRFGLTDNEVNAANNNKNSPWFDNYSERKEKQIKEASKCKPSK